MTKTKEVAKAFWDERAKPFGDPPRPFVKDERWELCLSYARAAIEAMREPTPEMLDAYWDAGTASEDVWKAMITAALRDTG